MYVVVSRTNDAMHGVRARENEKEKPSPAHENKRPKDDEASLTDQADGLESGPKGGNPPRNRPKWGFREIRQVLPFST